MLFSPIEQIEEARRQGSQYPDSTLRTHIVSYMCMNKKPRTALSIDKVYNWTWENLRILIAGGR